MWPGYKSLRKTEMYVPTPYRVNQGYGKQLTAEERFRLGAPPILSSTGPTFYNPKVGTPSVVKQANSPAAFFGPPPTNARSRGSSNASDPGVLTTSFTPVPTPKPLPTVATPPAVIDKNENLYNVFNESKPLGKRVKTLYNKKIGTKTIILKKEDEAKVKELGKNIEKNLLNISMFLYAMIKSPEDAPYKMIKKQLNAFLTPSSNRKTFIQNVAGRQGITSESLTKSIIGNSTKPGLLQSGMDATASVLAYNLTMRELPSVKNLVCKGEESFEPDKFRNMVLNTIVKIAQTFTYVTLFLGTNTGPRYESSLASAYNYFGSFIEAAPITMQSFSQRAAEGIQSKIKNLVQGHLPEGATDTLVKLADGLKKDLQELQQNILMIQMFYGEKPWTPSEEGEVASSNTEINTVYKQLFEDDIAGVQEEVIDAFDNTSTVLYNTLKYGTLGIGVVSTVAVAPILGLLGAVTGIGLGAGAVATTGLALAAPSLFMGGKRTRKAKRYGKKKYTRKH